MAKQQDNKRKGKSFDKVKKSKSFNKAGRASNSKPNSSKKPSYLNIHVGLSSRTNP